MEEDKSTLDFVFSVVESMNEEKAELEANHKKYLKIFHDEGMEEEYQKYVNGQSEGSQIDSN